MAMKTSFAAHVGALVIAAFALFACTATPSELPTPIPSRTTPDQAAQVVRTIVTGARPLLIPNTLAADWAAEVTADSSSFSAVYRSPDGKKTVRFAIAAANPPLPGPKSAQFHPGYHGDANSLYQISDTTVAAGERMLVWVEKGTWVISGRGEVPYVLSSSGLTHEEFWDIANGLHPNQI